jgi:HD-GYP domain-containing protein (c-di-GMP phosphodiesterase class II)
VPGALLESRAELLSALQNDPRFSDWSVRGEGPGWLELARGPVHLVLAWPEVWRDRALVAPHLTRARSGNYGLLLVGTAEELSAGDVDALADGALRVIPLAVPAAAGPLALSLRAIADAERRALERAEVELALERAQYETDLLIDIGRALSQERDRGALFDLILRRAREVTGADAGTIYEVEGDDPDHDNWILHFKESQNDSIALESLSLPPMKVSPKSIVGACVRAGEVINIPDLYALDPPGTGNNPWGFVHDRSFDQQHGYQTRSMITVPMISARNQCIGVIQLINKRARGAVKLTQPADFDCKVLPFDHVSTRFASTIASQAGIALETSQLYEEVTELFEGFVDASVTAIEARDPTTSGHSKRVADLTVGLAEVADRVDSGEYAGFRLSRDDAKQIEYAALLHDFGKVGVREHVLIKAKKLYEHDRALVEARFDYIRKAVEAEQSERKLRMLLEASRAEVAAELEAIDREAEAKLREVDDIVAFVLQANQPTVLEQGGFERIADIAARTFRAGDGSQRPYLTPEEATALQIMRGSLTEDERREIESHVVHTYNFLRQIPWGKTFRDVPEIAGAHHEKLDGTGYPKGRTALEIPPAAKMMTISDIFDALTASDRPYKKAVPIPKALDILKSEVDRNKLDGALFHLFVDARVWESALGKKP